MAQITPNTTGFGARVTGVDLSVPLDRSGFMTILHGLSVHGVLCFPGQQLEAPALKDFAGRFGTLEINVANAFQEPGHPEVMVLSDGWDTDESDRMLTFLFAHQLQPKFRRVHRWSEHDVLMWDNICTLHNAKPDYRPDEHRLIKRCQAMADRVFQPDFARNLAAAP